jgi:ferric-dicitrate binding protein FerR (iron transport regulator)
VTVGHEDLVALALGALEGADADRVREAADADPALAAELAAVRAHLAFHDRAPEIRPAPALWEGLRARLDRPAPRRPFLARYWMAAAAAALVVFALADPRGDRPQPVPLFGRLERSAGAYTAEGVSRVRIGDDVTVTLDDGTTFAPLSSSRLALRAGRAFFEVAPGGRGLRVLAGDLQATVTGTTFLVGLDGGRGYVFVESGEVRCGRGDEDARVAAGETFGAPPLSAARARAWFSRPTIGATILDATTLRVVIRNEMPDAIELAPPTGGEPFLFATYGGRDHPLTPPELEAPLALAPGEERSFEARLPRPLGQGDRLFVSCPRGDVRVEARR